MSTMRDPRAQRAVACRRNVAEKSPPAQKIERAYEDSFKQLSAGGLIVFDSPRHRIYRVKAIDMSKAAEQIPEQIDVFDESQQVKFYANQPEYGGYRKPLYPYLSRSFFLRYEDDIRELARAVIKKFLDRGKLEFLEDFAIPFSAGALTRAFLAIEVDERPFTAEERLGITTLFLDGPDATRGMLVNIAYHLATRDDVEARMKQPGLLSELLDECIGLELPASIMTRTFTNLASRDEAHRLGVAFARIQIAIAFEELLAAATNFRLAPDADIPRYTGSLLTSPSVLRLEFDRSAPPTAEEGSLPSDDTTVRSVHKIFAVRSDVSIRKSCERAC
jgi:cytochrome P450